MLMRDLIPFAASMHSNEKLDELCKSQKRMSRTPIFRGNLVPHLSIIYHLPSAQIVTTV